MKQTRVLLALCALLPTLAPAQPAVPDSPAIWREVTGVIDGDGIAGATYKPRFMRPHLPGYRTTNDGRIASAVEGSGPDGGIPRFNLLIPEKMTQPFLLSPGSSGIGDYSCSYTVLDSVVTRINVNNSYGTISLGSKNYTDGVLGVSHTTLWDAGNNPQSVAGEDVYNIQVVVSSNQGTSPNNHCQFFSTPIQITVSNPKTTGAFIRLIAKTGPTVAGALFSGFSGSAFEPVVCGDGRLLVTRVGSGNLVWTNPNTGVVQPAVSCDMVYSYYTSAQGAPGDASKWTNLIPITFAPSDTRINTLFDFARAPFRDPEGTLIPAGKDLGGSYPWIDREAKNLFFETVFDQLHFLANGNYNNGRYPQTGAPEDAPDYTQGEDGGKHQGVCVMGLWTHGKVVMVDNLLNDVDYAVGQGDTNTTGGTSTGPQQRMVTLFNPNSGPLGNETGILRMGYGRATKLMPVGENDNGDIIDSIVNIFNYRSYALPIGLRDVTWTMSDSREADEVAFDDYLDPDGFIVANMEGLLTTNATSGGSFKHWSGWNTTTHAFDQSVELQNAATSTSDRWITPKHGLVVGPGRLEPAATGGVHGKGFWMDGTIGLEFQVDAQPTGVDVHQHDWYIGIFADCRFANDTTERRLLTFPDGTKIALYGRSQVLYEDSTGAVINRISIPLPNTSAPTSAMDDLMPQKGWTHFGFQISQQGTHVEMHLNGILFNRWQDDFSSIFQMVAGKLTVGKPAAESVTGFVGWADEFKVFAHTVDLETACNHANGTLIGWTSGAYTGVWKTKFADRFPTWVQTEITNRLKNNGEPSYAQYACLYDYQHDNGSSRFSIPASTVSLRQSIHFPEGPLFHNAPRPDSSSNTFCTTCHHTTGQGGLDLVALSLDSGNTTSTDPRRQPMQPPQKVFGHIPIGLVDSTGLPSAATDTPAGGTAIDPWLLPSFSNSTAVQTFTVVDADTHQDLMVLTASAVVDPAKLGTTNLTLRANLNYGVGSATMQYDANPTNTKLHPPYTAFGTDASPWTGQVLTPGAHTFKATPQYGSLSSVSFTVAGNSTRVVAGYRSDFQTHSPKPGWAYLWNALGPITSAANYVSLNWCQTINRYGVNGFPVSPDNSSAAFPYGNLNSSGGHPGRGTTQGQPCDRYPIAAYTVKEAGYYALTGSSVTVTTSASNGGQLVVLTESAGVTTQKFAQTFPSVTPFTFNQNVGFLNVGDTIYVAVGPNTSDGSDSFQLDFSISFNESVNPI